MKRIFLSAAAMISLSGVAMAQTPPNPAPTNQELPQDRGHDKHTAKHDAVDAAEKPATQTLNASSLAVDTAVEAQNQKQYALDQAAYRAEVAARKELIANDEARYQAQTNAYADAMAAWRAQVAACKAGKTKACDMPAPTFAQYY
ncbi:hypothetical protein [Sphingomonas sp. ID0503]|uniref:hypothetical protein n=1 Tax=Sphingomonas sp. ID0503 TaxID=3399691 RepID=UPI003AFB4A7D